MNAELVLYLMEAGLPMDVAKDVAGDVAGNGGSWGELALAILTRADMTVARATELAKAAPLEPSKKLKPQNEGLPPAVQTALQADGDAPIRPRYVPVLDADGLTAKQRAALDRGIGLCANCQQPRNAHLPGCSVASGENPRAITKDRLPPVQ